MLILLVFLLEIKIYYKLFNVNPKIEKMKINPFKQIFIFLVFGIFFLNSCANLPGGDARKNPP
jgi:hypothetical protein